MKTANGMIEQTRSGLSTGSLLVCFFVMVMSIMALTTQGAYAAPGGGGGKGPGPNAKLSGTVTNSYTGLGIAGATVTLKVGANVVKTLVTDANGEYSDNKVPIGVYTVTTSADNYPDVVEQVNMTKGKVSYNVSMTPDARVIVMASLAGDMNPGEAQTATGSFIIMDGSSLVGTDWSQSGGDVAAAIADEAAATTNVTLGSASAYAEQLVEVLTDPPLTALPPDLVLQPINVIRKGLQDRYQVVAINPSAHEHAAEFELTFTVETTSGMYSAHAAEMVALPWPVSTGVRTVPVGHTVLMYAKEDGGYDWEITIAPGSSTAALSDHDTQTPWFTPDTVGNYLLTENVSGATVEVHAGGYHGVIDPVLTLAELNDGDDDNRPVPIESCTGCHMEGGAAPPNFDTWRNTGHAEAFTQGITTNSHFGERCFACHAVGFGEGGIDSAAGYDDFLADLNAAQHGGDISTLWVSLLTDQPAVAARSNIQCENCHGPQDYAQSHHTPDGTGLGTPRVNLGSETCGSCHGEPARHGRFQQWLLSNHADYDLARNRGASSGNCARCHSGNGFVEWSKLNFDYSQNVTVTWDQDTVVPQTCAACHDPHDTGTTSGSDGTNARVRVNADTGGTCGGPECDTYVLSAGFVANNVGKGATCMTCHSSRAATPRNDGTWASQSDSQKIGAPHHGVQADLIMGQNQYFTGAVAIPGAHALIEDTCVTCHMNATQPPDLLSYNQNGTNHTFAADPAICSDCHGAAGEFLAEQVDTEITGYLETLEGELGAAWMRLMEANYPITFNNSQGNFLCEADGVSSFVTHVEFALHRGTRLHVSVDDVECGGGAELDPDDIIANDGELDEEILENVALATNDGDIYKATWNYALNFEDETIIGCPAEDEPGYDPDCTSPHTHRGVHNHAFSQQGLLGAIAAVQQVAAP